jgi:hypothetical protein
LSSRQKKAPARGKKKAAEEEEGEEKEEVVEEEEEGELEDDDPQVSESGSRGPRPDAHDGGVCVCVLLTWCGSLRGPGGRSSTTSWTRSRRMRRARSVCVGFVFARLVPFFDNDLPYRSWWHGVSDSTELMSEASTGSAGRH